MTSSGWVVIEQMSGGLHGGLGSVGLLSSTGTRGNQHSEIDSALIVQDQ